MYTYIFYMVQPARGCAPGAAREPSVLPLDDPRIGIKYKVLSI